VSSHSARLSPLIGETTWAIVDGVLIQSRGKATLALPLSGLTRMTLIPAGPRRAYPSASLAFGMRRLTLPSASFGPRGVEPRSESFSVLIRDLARQAKAASPAARFVLAGAIDRRSPLVWAIALVGAGALVMALMSFSPAAAGIGVSLAARMAFVALLLGAALPWMGPGGRDFDPAAIPAGALRG
jgi:hypothetical protein